MDSILASERMKRSLSINS